MNEIKVVGTQEFMGKNIKVIEGGFGEGKRIITAKEVAEIHNMRLADLNASIKRLIDKSRLKEGIDYLDLLSETVSLRDFAKENGLIGSNKTSVVFVLSERGYSKLVKSMDDDESWEVMDKLIDEYFTMRQVIKSDEQLKAMYLLKAVESNGEESAIAIKNYTDLRIKEETKPLLDTIETQRPMVDFTNTVLKSKENILVRQLAKIITTEFNVNMGEKKLYKQLREWKMIFPNSTEPYQKYIDDGIFKVEEKPVETAYKTILTKTTKVTPIGQVKIVEKFRREIKNGKLNLNK